MPFQLYCTDQANNIRFFPIVYDDRDDALRCAWQMMGYGVVPREIIGDDGSIVGRRKIADEIQRRRGQLARPPKVY
jgi:hypothetical protein